MAVFLVCGLFVLGLGFGVQRTEGGAGVLGGPSSPGSEGGYGVPEATALLGQPALLEGRSLVEASFGSEVEGSFISVGSLRDIGTPVAYGTGGLITYIVQKGDTLSEIASRFGVSLQTVIGSNPEVRTGSLQVGQRLSILPVSGILYEVREGESPETVAASFRLTVNQLREFNRFVDFARFGPGTVLVIPGASPRSSPYPRRSGEPLDVRNYFVKPAEGFNWGRLHPRNAVDIANNCGTSIRAAAEGLVTDISTDSWSHGYGHYLVVEHPNGLKTRYAHLKKPLVSLGSYVEQGETIGTMGDTGEATGCHLHLEVEGARNPFAL